MTSGFAPPEQYEGRGSAATDGYGLAATLYYLWTGQAPVEASQRLLGKALPAVADLAPEVGLSAAAVMAGLALEEGQRPQQVRAWLDLLTPLRIASVTPMPAHPAPSRAPTRSTSGGCRARHPPARGRAGVIDPPDGCRMRRLQRAGGRVTGAQVGGS